MGLIMEYIVVLIYTTAGMKIPLQDDHEDGEDLLTQKVFSLTEQPHSRQAVYPLQGYAAPTWTGHNEA
jgi:hypothetical protein